MKIQKLEEEPFEFELINGEKRLVAFIEITDEEGKSSWGEAAPLPKWSKETLGDCFKQLDQKRAEIYEKEWSAQNCFAQLHQLNLLPSLSFGLESALLSLLKPLSEFAVSLSALFMGTPKKILEQAERRLNEGYTSAKLKVAHLSFKEAAYVIGELKDFFRLRIDVNRAWSRGDSLRFFSQFPLNAFDYVEEPFENPQDLSQFLHPLAVDESFPQDLSLEQLELLPTLKALIYKPTIQGGMLRCLPLLEWSNKNKISLVLSSSFESSLGLSHIAALAHRLALTAPIGIGTCHYEPVEKLPKVALNYTNSPLSIFRGTAKLLLQ